MFLGILVTILVGVFFAKKIVKINKRSSIKIKQSIKGDNNQQAGGNIN